MAQSTVMSADEAVVGVVYDPEVRAKPDPDYDALRGEMTGGTGRPWFEQQGQFMLFLDPPDHTRIRSLVSRAFTPRYLQRLRPQIVERVDDLVSALADAGGGDLIADLA